MDIGMAIPYTLLIVGAELVAGLVITIVLIWKWR